MYRLLLVSAFFMVQTAEIELPLEIQEKIFDYALTQLADDSIADKKPRYDTVSFLAKQYIARHIQKPEKIVEFIDSIRLDSESSDYPVCNSLLFNYVTALCKRDDISFLLEQPACLQLLPERDFIFDWMDVVIQFKNWRALESIVAKKMEQKNETRCINLLMCKLADQKNEEYFTWLQTKYGSLIKPSEQFLCACQGDFIDQVRHMLPDRLNDTPEILLSTFSIACGFNNIKCQLLLLESDYVKPTTINNNPSGIETAFGIACKYNSLPAVQWMVEHGWLIASAENDNKSSFGTRINEECYYGRTPLQVAFLIRYPSLDFVRYLISCGADCNKLAPQNDITPLMCALRQIDDQHKVTKIIEMITFLVEEGGAKVNHVLKGYEPNTILDFVHWQGGSKFPEIGDYLKSKGAISGMEQEQEDILIAAAAMFNNED